MIPGPQEARRSLSASCSSGVCDWLRFGVIRCMSVICYLIGCSDVTRRLAYSAWPGAVMVWIWGEACCSRYCSAVHWKQLIAGEILRHKSDQYWSSIRRTALITAANTVNLKNIVRLFDILKWISSVLSYIAYVLIRGKPFSLCHRDKLCSSKKKACKQTLNYKTQKQFPETFYERIILKINK